MTITLLVYLQMTEEVHLH